MQSSRCPQKKGRFELADGGTIFLDEIGEIDQSTQIKILRVLQERTFERVGGEETISVDVRIIAATNKDLEEEVRKGNFRQDLFYRLNVVHISVPPLRERKEDISLLVASFLKTFNEEDGKSVEGFTPAARKAIMAYSWPGNIRELRNTVESCVVMARGRMIDVDQLPFHITDSDLPQTVSLKIGTSLESAEKKLILATIDWCKGNKTRAAEVLGIGRKTLHRKLDEYGEKE